MQRRIEMSGSPPASDHRLTVLVVCVRLHSSPRLPDILPLLHVLHPSLSEIASNTRSVEDRVLTREEDGGVIRGGEVWDRGGKEKIAAPVEMSL